MYSVSLTKVDLPEPETPVTHVINPMGMSILIFFKLFEFAPCILTNLPFGLCLSSGTIIFLLPEIYIPVIDFLFFSISSGVPSAIISPP